MANKKKQKTTDHFKKAIQEHIDHTASVNPMFAKKVENPDKNIDDCVTYILNQVKNSGQQGFHDMEVYGMARHYYEQEKLDIGKNVKCEIIINDEVQLTPEEIEEARKEAREKVMKEEMEKMRKKPTKKKAEEKPKTNSGDAAAGTLFS